MRLTCKQDWAGSQLSGCFAKVAPVPNFPRFLPRLCLKMTPGWASCDAKPGCESSLEIDRSGSQAGGQAATPTPLLDHRQHTGDER